MGCPHNNTSSATYPSPFLHQFHTAPAKNLKAFRIPASEAKPFTRMDAAIDKADLCGHSRSLLNYLLNRSDNWTFIDSVVQQYLHVGRDKLWKLLKGLAEKRFIHIYYENINTDRRGRLAGRRMIDVYENQRAPASNFKKRLCDTGLCDTDPVQQPIVECLPIVDIRIDRTISKPKLNSKPRETKEVQCSDALKAFFQRHSVPVSEQRKLLSYLAKREDSEQAISEAIACTNERNASNPMAYFITMLKKGCRSTQSKDANSEANLAHFYAFQGRAAWRLEAGWAVHTSGQEIPLSAEPSLFRSRLQLITQTGIPKSIRNSSPDQFEESSVSKGGEQLNSLLNKYWNVKA